WSSSVTLPASRSPRPLRLSTSPRQPPIATGLTPAPGCTDASSGMPRCSFPVFFWGCFVPKGALSVEGASPAQGSRGMDEASIFLEALNQPAPAERAAFLDQACGGNDELRHSVELLLRAHDQAGGFLAEAPAPGGATAALPSSEAPGAVLGPYKLLEPIGEGGMGTVWLAAQAAPGP